MTTVPWAMEATIEGPNPFRGVVKAAGPLLAAIGVKLDSNRHATQKSDLL